MPVSLDMQTLAFVALVGGSIVLGDVITYGIKL
jgi:hypothetical protein